MFVVVFPRTLKGIDTHLYMAAVRQLSVNKQYHIWVESFGGLCGIYRCVKLSKSVPVHNELDWFRVSGLTPLRGRF